MTRGGAERRNGMNMLTSIANGIRLVAHTAIRRKSIVIIVGTGGLLVVALASVITAYIVDSRVASERLPDFPPWCISNETKMYVGSAGTRHDEVMFVVSQVLEFRYGAVPTSSSGFKLRERATRVPAATTWGDVLAYYEPRIPAGLTLDSSITELGVEYRIRAWSRDGLWSRRAVAVVLVEHPYRPFVPVGEAPAEPDVEFKWLLVFDVNRDDEIEEQYGQGSHRVSYECKHAQTGAGSPSAGRMTHEGAAIRPTERAPASR